MVAVQALQHSKVLDQCYSTRSNQLHLEWLGRRVSDKYIVENSGYLTHLLPGDVVLADRDLMSQIV